MCQCHNEEDARRIVDAVNGALSTFQYAVRDSSRIDKIAAFLRFAGKPLHITDIAQQLGKKRIQIEPGILKHIGHSKSPRLYRHAPSTYGLIEWK